MRTHQKPGWAPQQGLMITTHFCRHAKITADFHIDRTLGLASESMVHPSPGSQGDTVMLNEVRLHTSREDSTLSMMGLNSR